MSALPNDLLGVRTITRRRAALLLLVMLVIADVLMIVLHVRASLYGGSLARLIDFEDGHAEMIGTIKWLWLIFLLGVLAALARRWVFAALIPLVIFFLLTDTFQLHERLGEQAVIYFDIQPALRLRAVDFGEMLVAAAGAVLTVPIALIGWARSRGADRRAFNRIVQILVLLFMFGVVLDQLHIAFPVSTEFDWLAVVEDGGELLTISLLLAFCFALAQDPPHGARGPDHAEPDREPDRQSAPTAPDQEPHRQSAPTAPDQEPDRQSAPTAPDQEPDRQSAATAAGPLRSPASSRPSRRPAGTTSR